MYRNMRKGSQKMKTLKNLSREEIEIEPTSAYSTKLFTKIVKLTDPYTRNQAWWKDSHECNC